MSKHTPGPWAVHQLTGSAFGDVGIRADGEVVAGYVALMNTRWPHATQQEEQRANAKLIAAAPELLEALAETLIYLPEHPEDRSLREAVCRARAAIAKATGEA